MADLSALSDAELEHLASQIPQGGGAKPASVKGPDLASLSDAELEHLAAQIPKPKSSNIGAAITGAKQAIPLFNTLQAAAEGAISGAQTFDSLGGNNMPLLDRIKGALSSGVDEFKTQRNLNSDEARVAHEQNPKSYMAGQLAGGVATGAALPIGVGATGFGAIQGANEALNNAQSLGEAATDVGGGALTGAVAGRLVQQAGGLTNGLRSGLNSEEGSAIARALGQKLSGPIDMAGDAASKIGSAIAASSGKLASGATQAVAAGIGAKLGGGAGAIAGRYIAKDAIIPAATALKNALTGPTAFKAAVAAGELPAQLAQSIIGSPNLTDSSIRLFFDNLTVPAAKQAVLQNIINPQGTGGAMNRLLSLGGQ